MHVLSILLIDFFVKTPVYSFVWLFVVFFGAIIRDYPNDMLRSTGSHELPKSRLCLSHLWMDYFYYPLVHNTFTYK